MPSYGPNEFMKLMCPLTVDWTKLLSLIPRAYLKQTDNAEYGVPLTSLVVHDTGQPLPSAPAADDLGLVAGTFGTGVPSLQSIDFGTLTTTVYARWALVLPPEYVAGQSVTLRFHAGALTTIADTSLTLDVEAYLSDEEAVVSGADLCATDPQNINNLTMTDFDFTITPNTLEPGDTIDVRIAVAVVDAATGPEIKAIVGKIAALLDVRG